ncbi:MAG: hypothetical protein LBT95_09935, partial [Treponema sp.]|nr:hypothetical protein [Treponema sp.]
MKKRFVENGIAGAVLVLGLILMGCASTGATHFDPPDGKYYSSSGGNIFFYPANGSWEAIDLGYRGSFDFNAETGGITLNAEQAMRGFRWVDEPV